MPIYKLGTEVRLKKGRVEGIITAISIRGTGVVYEISWYTDDGNSVIWAFDFEFDVIDERCEFYTLIQT